MKIAITPPEESDIPLALRTEKCNNIIGLLLLVRDASVMGFMSGGMVADTASEGFCNYLNIHRQEEPQDRPRRKKQFNATHHVNLQRS